MKQTWRWFGPDDPVKLTHVRQAGATGVVSALHHINDGRAWPIDEVMKRKAEIEAAGLAWDVVESIIVHEDIKTRSGRHRELIDNYKASIRALAKAGIETICYNFMAITDWTRTDLDYPMWHGGTALRFDMVEFCAYDVLVLKRHNAEADHPADRIAAAKTRLASWWCATTSWRSPTGRAPISTIRCRMAARRCASMSLISASMMRSS